MRGFEARVSCIVPKVSRSRRVRLLGFALGIIVLAAAVGLGVRFVRNRAPAGAELATLPDGDSPLTTRPGGTARVLFLGDTHFGESYLRGTPPADTLEREGYGHALARVRPLLRSADLVVANLETPLTALRSSPLEGDKPYVHWGAPQRTAAQLAADRVSVVSLANNHTMDFLEPGLRDTLSVLAAHGIRFFGAGNDLRQAARPYRHDIQVGAHTLHLAIIGAFEHRASYVGYQAYARSRKAGVYALRQRTVTEQIRALAQAHPELWIVVFPHWGRNYRFRTETQYELAHAMVDAGADLVVGHGAHAFQEVEPHGERFILYGLGNFVFLSPGRYHKRDIHPISMAACLAVTEQSQGLDLELRLYFIASDNTETGFQPYVVSGPAFDVAREALLQGGNLDVEARRRLRAAQQVVRDDVGIHIRLPLGTTP